MAEPEITLKNTKAEILDALNRALERAEAAEKGRLNPEKQEKEKNEKKAVESAKKAADQEIFSKELIEKFMDMQAAIAVEEGRLQELYGVGRELQRLALAIEAGRERIAEIQAEKSEKEEAAAASLKKLREEYTQKNAELQSEQEAYIKKLKLERTREAEEYQYALTRTREKENNAWADQKAAREAELQKREARAAEMLAEAESKAEYIRSLETKAESIPALLAAEKTAAVAAAAEALEREHGHRDALAEMERKSAAARLDDRVKYLEKELDGSAKAVASLQGKLDKAYSEMRDLAAKTVETAGVVKFIGGADKTGG